MKCEKCGSEIEFPFGASRYCKGCSLKVRLAREKEAYHKNYNYKKKCKSVTKKLV